MKRVLDEATRETSYFYIYINGLESSREKKNVTDRRK